MPTLKIDHTDPIERRFRAAKWNRLITVRDDHRLFGLLAEYRGWTKAQHEDRARACLQDAAAMRREYERVASAAERAYGSAGPLIACVQREHWPADVKDQLRQLGYGWPVLEDLSLAHWKASGRRVDSWRKVRAEIAAEGDR